jgi:dipeptidyl aminopeptidase/acylaminoacyl peptidase
MRRAILIFLILTFLLTACGTLEVTLTNSDELLQTPSASDSPAAGPAPLNMSSTSAEIRQLLLDSPFHWKTIFTDAQVTTANENPRQVQVWVDQPNLSARSLSGEPNGAASTLRVADRLSLLYLDIPTGESKLVPFLDETTSVPYTPVPLSIQTEGIQSHPLSTATDPAMSNLLFPSDLAQNEGTFKPIAAEVVAYHLCLVVEWTYIQETLPSYRAWVDVSTGVFLRFQQFDKGGGSDILSEVTVTRVDYDLSYSPDLFSVNIISMPNFVTDPLTPSVVAVTPAAFESADPLGMVYSFVADNSYPVRVMRLISLPASCVIGESDCPEPDVIQTPVDLVSSLQPLVWSPENNEAAWAYPVNADARIWTLYLFNPVDKTWKELVQMDRYMDPPMWSQSGDWLAFRVQDGQGGSEVYAVRRDGSGLRNLTDTDKLPAEGQPYVMDAWLGENVVLRSSVPGQPGTIYLLRVEDGFVKPLFETSLTKAPFIESPDGTLLAYVDYDYNSQKQLVKILTPDGKTLRDLATFASGSVMSLTWSPEGTQLAFSHRTDTTSSVYVIDSDGRNLRQVYMSTTDTQFVFSPNGKYILVQTIDGTGEHLYSVDLSSLQSRLVQAPGIALNEAWMLPSWNK